jgi:hypothetical protein
MELATSRQFSPAALTLLGLTLGLACSGATPSAPTPTDRQIPLTVAIPLPDVDDPVLAACPSASQIAAFPLVVDFAAEIRSQPLVCRASSGSADLSHRQLYVYVVLLSMEKLRFSRALPWTDKTLWAWFVDLHPRISVVTSGLAMCSPCNRGGATLVIPMPTQTAINWRNVVRSIGGYAHEARHIEVGGHPCGTRDRLVADLQAFGVHNQVYEWVASHIVDGVVDDAVRDAARGWACEQRNSAFCEDRCPG